MDLCNKSLIIASGSGGKRQAPAAKNAPREEASIMSEVITCIEDLRVLAKRRVPKMFYDYANSGSWTEGTYRANEADFQKILLRQRVAVDMSNRTLATTMVGQPVSMPIALAPVGMTGMQHAGRRDPGGARGRRRRHPLHALHHEHLLHRGRGGEYRQAVLVSALRHARQGFHRSPDRPRQGRRLLGAGADARPADPRRSATRTSRTACPRRPR